MACYVDANAIADADADSVLCYAIHAISAMMILCSCFGSACLRYAMLCYTTLCSSTICSANADADASAILCFNKLEIDG